MALLGAALLAAAIAPFSTHAPGSALPPGWRELGIARVNQAEIALVVEEGSTVLRVRSNASAGAASFALRDAPQGALLSWRWKIDRVVEKADLATKAGDDFAARVYVFFDVPMASLTWGQRLKLRIARLVYGADVPAASLCYVWDNRHPTGTSAWNPYTDRVRTVVVESGGERAGRWVEETRDVESDFHAAFGDKVAPRITGLAAGNDTDQTGEEASAWFGDFRLEARP